MPNPTSLTKGVPTRTSSEALSGFTAHKMTLALETEVVKKLNGCVASKTESVNVFDS